MECCTALRCAALYPLFPSIIISVTRHIARLQTCFWLVFRFRWHPVHLALVGVLRAMSTWLVQFEDTLHDRRRSCQTSWLWSWSWIGTWSDTRTISHMDHPWCFGSTLNESWNDYGNENGNGMVKWQARNRDMALNIPNIAFGILYSLALVGGRVGLHFGFICQDWMIWFFLVWYTT